MKRLLKIIGVVVVATVVVLALSNMALHILLPPEKAKAMVLKQMTGRLKREVTLGNVSVGLLSGLSVSDLKISEAPDFSRGTFVSSDHFSIRLAILPLLFRKVVVKQVILDHPVITAVRLADGKTFNFSDLMEATTAQAVPKTAQAPRSGFVSEAFAAPSPAASSQNSEPPPFALVVSHAQVQNGVLHFVDQSPAQQSVDIDPLNLKLKNVSLTSPFAFQAFLKAKARNVVATLKLAGEADLATGSFKIKDCALSSGGSTLVLEGKASQLKSNQPVVDMHLDIKEFKLSTLAPFMPLPPGFKMEGPIIGRARVKGDQKRMDLSLQIDLEKVGVVYAKQFSKPARVPMGVTLQGVLSDLQDVDLSELKAVLGSFQLTGHGKVLAVRSPQPQINLHLETNAFPAAELTQFAAASLPKDLMVKGRAQLSADVSGTQTSSQVAVKFEGKDLDLAMGETFKKPAGTPLHVAVMGESVKAVGKPVSRKAPAGQTPQVFNIQNLNAAVGPISLSGSGSVQTTATPMKFQLALKSNTFPLQDLAGISPMAGSYKLSGSAATEMRVSGPVDAPQANGTLTLHDVALRYQQSDLTQINTALTFTLQDVAISKLTGKLNGSDIALKLTGHKLATQPDINVEANLAELDLAKLLAPPGASSTSNAHWGFLVPVAWAAAPPPAAPPAKLTGHLTIGHIKHEFYDARDLDVKWNLTDVTPDLSLVNGSTVLRQGGGLLRDLDKLVAMSKSAHIMLLPILTVQNLDKAGLLRRIGLPSLEKISFNKIDGDYTFRSGVMEIKNFEIVGRDIHLNTTGSIGLAGAQPLNVRATVKMPPGSIGGTVGNIIRDATGWEGLAFTAQGTVPDPKVKLDTEDLGRRAIQQLGRETLKKLGIGNEPPPKAPQDNPPGDQQAPDQTIPQPPSEQPAPPRNTVKDIEKALKGILGK